MKVCCHCATLLCCIALLATGGAADRLGNEPDAAPELSLTLVPPSPVTERITVDIRGALRNPEAEPRNVTATVYLDEERSDAILHRAALAVPARGVRGFSTRWPAAGRAGRHRIVLVVEAGDRKWRTVQPLEIRESTARSPGRLGGAWVDIHHHDPAEGKPFDADLDAMTDAQWRELVQAMRAVDQNVLVITMMFQNFTHRGRHKIETEGYTGKAYYPSRLFPGRMAVASPDPLEAILSEADRLGMHVLPGVGNYAFFDFGAGSLRWHKQVATELWERYGRHPSFYGWYVSEEKDGGLGNPEEREEIVAFFREFTSYVRTLAPDKPVMLAPNCFHLRGAEDTYRQLLPHLDILCPFGFHRMPAGDLRGEEAATLMQSLCDTAGCHLWMDLESFVFRNGSELHPRSIQGLVSDFSRFPNFETTLHYQFPGLMCSPGMSRKPGGEAAVRLYNDYRRFLEVGIESSRIPHAARGASVTLSTPPAANYPGRAGASSLTDGELGEPDPQSAAWLGFEGCPVSATVDLGTTRAIDSIRVNFLQYTPGGIFRPARIEIAVGDTEENLGPVRTLLADSSADEVGPCIRTFTASDLGVRGRYLRIRAESIGPIPPGHPAAGKPSWLFLDEILLNAAQ
jgi:hypothetical protein